jgi:hypothetical protein
MVDPNNCGYIIINPPPINRTAADPIINVVSPIIAALVFELKFLAANPYIASIPPTNTPNKTVNLNTASGMPSIIIKAPPINMVAAEIAIIILRSSAF